MAINLKLPKLPKSNKIPKGKIPTKRHINVMIRKKQSFSARKHLPILILIVVLLIAFCKFMVFDRVYTVVREASQLNTMQSELAAANAQIQSMGELEDEYAHYTVSGMTEEELNRVNRVEAMKLVDEAFQGGNVSRSWNLTGNIMTLEVTGPSLSELNQLASELEINPIVERCVISSADKRTDEDGNVSVTFIIYLQKPGATETTE